MIDWHKDTLDHAESARDAIAETVSDLTTFAAGLSDHQRKWIHNKVLGRLDRAFGVGSRIQLIVDRLKAAEPFSVNDGMLSAEYARLTNNYEQLSARYENEKVRRWKALREHEKLTEERDDAVHLASVKERHIQDLYDEMETMKKNLDAYKAWIAERPRI